MSQTMMTAIAIEGGKGAAEALKPVQMPVPVPANGEILIRVRAAGVNRPDIVQRLGFYPAPPGAPETLGLEVAGVDGLLRHVVPRRADDADVAP
jgi:NADPH:quinone reductase-like Zn-dependent oxidoreductase